MIVDTLEKLESLYGTPGEASLIKVADRLTPEYRTWIEASPFAALATIGPEGLDCTPRGDDGQVVYVEDERTLALPDRRGNNRMDSLRNLVRDPRCSLMFLVPGSPTVIRVNGTGTIVADDDTLTRYEMRGAKPRSVLKVTIGELYFQCARAVMRAGLWSGADAPEGLPTPGQILEAMSKTGFDGTTYDKDWPARAAKSMW